ncbi:MAG: TraR/DksA family transcriptional regulator [Nitrospiraceae bacterium]|nr:MAG: TraR/DksA family transcriptional regulator [Nitrospiraceae bacterium]
MTSKSRPHRAVKAVKPAKAAAKAKIKAKAKTKARTPARAHAKATASAPKAKAAPAVKGAASNLRKDILRKILIARRQEVMKEIDELLGNRMSDEYQRRVDSAPDVGDQALLDTERVRDISILEMRNRMRQQIDEALIKLEEGTYGRCADCKVEISEKRLRTVPFARRCVACQSKQELLEKIELEPEEHEP